MALSYAEEQELKRRAFVRPIENLLEDMGIDEELGWADKRSRQEKATAKEIAEFESRVNQDQLEADQRNRGW